MGVPIWIFVLTRRENFYCSAQPKGKRWTLKLVYTTHHPYFKGTSRWLKLKYFYKNHWGALISYTSIMTEKNLTKNSFCKFIYGTWGWRMVQTPSPNLSYVWRDLFLFMAVVQNAGFHEVNYSRFADKVKCIVYSTVHTDIKVKVLTKMHDLINCSNISLKQKSR